MLIPSAYNEAALGDVENFIGFYKDDFDVYLIVDREIPSEIEKADGVFYVQKKTRTATYLEITADYIIDAGAVAGNSKHLRTQKRVSVWHGTPYKKMFVDLDKRHAVTAIDYAKNFDLMVSPSEWYTERFLRRSMLYEGEVLETGISRTDSLFISEERKKELRERFGIAEGKKVLLYAPTFRQAGPFDMPFSPERVRTVLGDGWEIVVKAHYLNELSDPSGVIDATKYPSINNLMAIADLMITDYSSVLFDYSVLGRPALLYQYDREEYENDRSFMFSMEDHVAAEDIVFDEDALCRRLAEADRLGSNLSGIKETFYPHQKEGVTEELVGKLGFDSTPRELGEVIFLVNHLHENGGVQSFIINLAREFKKKYNAKVYVFGVNEFNAAKDDIVTFDEDDVTDMKLSYEVNPKSIRAILSRTDGYIISCQYSAQLQFQHYLAGKKTVLMFHGDTKDIVNRTIYSWHLDAISKGRLKNYRRLIFLTPENCRVIRDHVPAEVRDRIISMENGYDFSDGKDLYKENGEFVLVSRLDHDKNAMEAVEIFASEHMDPALKLHVYGDGVQRGEIEARIKELGLSERVILHGYESNKEKIYGDRQGVISVSLTEGLPLVFLEAAKYGLPVYAYDSFTSCRDLVSDKTGVLIKTGDRDAFAGALSHPFDMSAFDSSVIREEFSADTVTEKWKNLFDELDREESSAADSRPADVISAQKPDLRKRIRNSRFFSGNERYAELSTAWNVIRDRKWQKTQPLVSVIMPFYNNNATVREAVRSVERCGYRNYEILLINDGSAQDPQPLVKGSKKLRYFYKENGGLGDTRNYGIERAKGKYVIFLDSDDTLYPNSLNRLAKYAEKHDLQMAGGKTVRRYVSTGADEYWYPAIYEKDQINTSTSRQKLIDDTIATGKLYSRELLVSEGIRFASGLYEDIPFTGRLYAMLDRIGIVSGIVQKWMIYGTNTSITTSRTLENAEARLRNVDEVFRMQKTDVCRIFYTRQYIRHQMIAALGGFNTYNDDEKRRIYELIRKGIEMRKEYVLDRLQVSPSKKELCRALTEGDYERFSLLATGFSAAQLEGKEQS